MTNARAAGHRSFLSFRATRAGSHSCVAHRYPFFTVKYWTVEEARAYLPRVAEILSLVRGVATAAAKAPGNGHGPVGAESDVRAGLEELRAGDIILRDPESGLIDFPARGPDGVVYLLCWRDPEPDLAWWHLPEEGFAGRKPLPRNPA